MPWHEHAGPFLLRAAAGGLAVLTLGALAILVCRPPVLRARLALLTILGAAAVPWLALVPPLPHWSAPILPATRMAPDAIEPPRGPVPIPPPLGDPKPTPAAGVRPAESVSPPPSPPPSIAGLLLVAHAVGSAILLGWWLCGQVALLRLARGARPARRSARDLFLALSGPAGARVRLLESDRIALPFTFTRSRPVILLPSTLAAGHDEATLRYALAHEWSHVERRDARAWDLAVLAGVLLFYLPPYWWLRRQLRLCQDFLADDRAAALGSPGDYASCLVRLARVAARPQPLPALGIGDRRPDLSRRIAMLLKGRKPLLRRCRPAWSLLAAISAAAVVLLASGFRLAAAPREDEPPPAKEGAKAEDLHYSGTVKDKDTGKPIAGASVSVRRMVNSSVHHVENRVLEETRHTTDAEGVYRFAIPAAQAAQRDLYIELDVEHPDYAPQIGFGYWLKSIRKLEALGDRPFFESVELRRGQAITGHVRRPDGSPAAGVEVRAFSRGGDPDAKRREAGSSTRGTTDAEGAFRVVLATPGRAVFWIEPDDLAPEGHLVPDGRRGDLGDFTLKAGVVVSGRVVDVEGKPLGGVFVNAERQRVGTTDPFFPWADATYRVALSADDGTFTLAPLPAGSYLLKPGNRALRRSRWDGVVHNIPATFTTEGLTIEEGHGPIAVEVRAVPEARVEARWVNSKGVPTRGSVISLGGKTGGLSWLGDLLDPVADGKVVVRVPRGMADAYIQLWMGENHASGWRMGPGQPLGRTIVLKLGTVDRDIRGIELIEYVAPTVLVKARTADGKPVPGLMVTGRYADPPGSPPHWVVSFEGQSDGRHRSGSFPPDLAVTVTAQAEGFKPASQTVTLPEGKEEEIVLTLEPK